MAYAFEMKIKAMQVREATGPAIKVSTDIAAAFADIANLDREAFYVVTLNQKHKVIDRHLISLGTLTASLVHPREVFKPCIMDNAAAIILVHNHPSGDPTPSKEDREITARLHEGAKMLGFVLMDHIIIGRPGHHSFQDEGSI
jgi:DNA repair protein RadC